MTVVEARALSGLSLPVGYRWRKWLLEDGIASAVSSRCQGRGSVEAAYPFSQVEAAARPARTALEEAVRGMLGPQTDVAVPMSIVWVERLAAALASYPRGRMTRQSHGE